MHYRRIYSLANPSHGGGYVGRDSWESVFFESVVTFFGLPRVIVTDRGANFCSRFFSTLAQLLRIKHRISSARSLRTNGLAESLVQRVSGLIKSYSQDDLQIPEILPFCSMALRATNHTRLQLSPYELTFGRKMSLGMPAELTDVLPKSPEKQQCYLKWLQHHLSELHASVNLNIEENKREMKRTYDRRMKVQTPKWEIGIQFYY